MNPNQIYVSPQGQLLGPQGQPLGYTAVQTPQGLIAVPNQALQGPQQQGVGQQALGAVAGMSPMMKLALAVAVLGGGYWLYKRYIRPKTEEGGKRSLREYAARRSRSRLAAEVKRFLEQHPGMREELGAAEDDEDEACEACEDGACEDHMLEAAE